MSQEKRRRPKQKRKQKKFGVLNTIIMVIAVCVFLFSALQLYKIFSEYAKGSKEYEKVVLAATNNKKEGDKFKVDFDKLLEMNPDTIGWIRFEEPAEINYPIVKGIDNAKYLTKTFEENDNKLGTLFVDMNNANDFTDSNTIIYGHNMKNGSMFAKLLKYKEEAFYKENPEFYIYTPDGKESKYKIYSVEIVEDTSDAFQISFDSKENFQTYLDNVKDNSMYQTEINATVDSKMITLSTCTNVRDTERFLVHGIKVELE